MTTTQHIVIFGATGGTGLEIVYQALQKGHHVTVLCRDPSKLLVPPASGHAESGKHLVSPRLHVVVGDATKASDVASALESTSLPITSVVVALGGKFGVKKRSVLATATKNIINAMKANDARKARLLVITSIGAGDTEHLVPFDFKVIKATLLRAEFADKNSQESLFLAPGAPGSDLSFTIIRPPSLVDKPPVGMPSILDDNQKRLKTAHATRADVATICIKAATDATWEHSGKAVNIDGLRRAV
mmetsp:Transcript_7928/g.21694  ORF Transcript_7928/g.21694 Transcript_7928/m.21694 type:complete len:245 (+) Transcript_7928:63-797(+)